MNIETLLSKKGKAFLFTVGWNVQFCIYIYIYIYIYI
jgi:hypothetical protein